MSYQRTIALRLTGENAIHCSGCERTIEFTLSRLPGVEKVKADHRTQHIELVTSTVGADLEKVKSELEWIGYQVEEL